MTAGANRECGNVWARILKDLSPFQEPLCVRSGHRFLVFFFFFFSQPSLALFILAWDEAKHCDVRMVPQRLRVSLQTGSRV